MTRRKDGRDQTTLEERGCDAIARNLREFGYPDVTPRMIHDILGALREGKRDLDLPHGIIGHFAQEQIMDNPDIFGRIES